MNWFLLACIGHLANGAAFVIDKILLRSAFSRSATYAGIVGALSALVLLAFPFVKVWPVGSMWAVAILSGAIFILALWTFFAALARAETSRVVPIVGSLIPILTLAGSFIFIGERLSDQTFLGFGLLILATFLLSSEGKGRPTHDTIWLAVTSAFLFAGASIAAKATYDATGFLGGFIATRIGSTIMAALILCVFDREAGREVLTIFLPSRRKRSSKHKQPGAMAGLLAIIGQSLGSIGFLFVQLATARGSASIVNAMQATQYAFLVIIGLVLAKKAPHLLGENATRKTIIIKVIALAITGLGMYLIV